MMFYTGIGSRTTPQNVQSKMTALGRAFALHGLTLRSGAAPGADFAFEKGCDSVQGNKEIYLPWKSFAGHKSNFYSISNEVFSLTADVYGQRWRMLSSSSQKLLARDIQQIYGRDLEGINTLDRRSRFVVCWTQDGCRSKNERSKTTSGTGQAIASATWFDHIKIPIFNLYHESDYDDVIEYVGRLT